MKVWVLFSRPKKIQIAGLIALLFLPTLSYSFDFSKLPKQETLNIADQIFANECNRSLDCLVAWNDGENFASLGIGHFIWFPANVYPPFQESFPDLLAWMAKHQIEKPISLSWLSPQTPCPWPNKEAFLDPSQQTKIEALRDWLAQNKAVQASFILNRLQGSLDKILLVSTADEAKVVRAQFSRVAQASGGGYILADYVNFKGEGVNPKEQYQGQGWGLRQVLLSMSNAPEAAQSFVSAAKSALIQRVALSPPERGEKRWLKGWFKRLDTYLQ